MRAGRWTEIGGTRGSQEKGRRDDGQRVRVTKKEGEKRSSELKEQERWRGRGRGREKEREIGEEDK